MSDYNDTRYEFLNTWGNDCSQSLALTGMDQPPCSRTDPRRVVLADVGLRHAPDKESGSRSGKGGAATSNQ